MGTAVQKAARDLKQQFLQIGAQAMGVKPRQVQVADGALVCGESRLTFKGSLRAPFRQKLRRRNDRLRRSRAGNHQQ
jgi:CO/xanthine dehydrogenase Mo-binding subunit